MGEVKQVGSFNPGFGCIQASVSSCIKPSSPVLSEPPLPSFSCDDTGIKGQDSGTVVGSQARE